MRELARAGQAATASQVIVMEGDAPADPAQAVLVSTRQ
jgi:hypothetical protein